MIYLYGLIDMAGPLDATVIANMPSALGPMRADRVDNWTVVTSAFDGEVVLPKRRLMLAHTKIVETMMAHGTVLPARFGLLADNFVAVESLLRARATQIASEFSRVRDCVELGIRISFDRDAALQATLQANPALLRKRDMLAGQGPEAHFSRAEFGREIAERLDERRGASQHALLQALTPLATSHVLRAPEEDVEVLRAEFLLPQSDQDSFVRSVDLAARKLTFAPNAEPLVQVIGPAPPYNFVSLSLTPDDAEEAA